MCYIIMSMVRSVVVYFVFGILYFNIFLNFMYCTLTCSTSYLDCIYLYPARVCILAVFLKNLEMLTLHPLYSQR